MKKIISAAVSAVTVLSCFSLTAAATNDDAQKLPFELEAPTGLSLMWMEGGDSPTSISVAFSMNDSMCKWLDRMADTDKHDEALKELSDKYKLDDMWVNVQIDWAIDDPENGWHYTKYWDGESFTDDNGVKQWAPAGQDKNYQNRVGIWDVVDGSVATTTVSDIWIMRGNTLNNDPSVEEDVRKSENEWFYGTDLIPGLKNQLKDDQYTLVETDPETKEQMISIDYTKHTTYIRARWMVTCRHPDHDEPVFSEWSETAGYGKDAEGFVLMKKEELPAPVISGLRYYPDEFNGYPQVACTLDVPAELDKKHTEIVANRGDMRVYWEARVPGGEWIEQQAGHDITAGENIISLLFLGEDIANKNKENGEDSDLVLEKDSPIELRARYFCDQSAISDTEAGQPFYSDYSEVLTFGSQEMSKTEQPSIAESSVAEETEESKIEPKKGEDETHKCSVCGICPVQPLGICLFIWIAIIVVIIIIVIVVVVVVKKKKNKENENNKS